MATPPSESLVALPPTLEREAVEAFCAHGAFPARVDASAVTRADGAGVALLWLLRRRGALVGEPAAAVAGAVRAFEAAQATVPAPRAEPNAGALTRLGQTVCASLARWGDAVRFLGETLWSLTHLFSGRFRWGDCRQAFVRCGVQAVPVMVLIGFLLGLILAFQSAIPLKLFGGQGFVGGLVGIALIRELGVLVGAILMAGRSGSAFAAELGAMKVNEEIDALETMGVRPVRFLVLPRVVAGTLALPLLALFVSFAGLVGGGVVMNVLGFSGNYYLHQLQTFVGLNDILGSFAKAFVFGFAVSEVGCWFGLRAGRDAGAVGTATTAAVVTGIVTIAVLEGVFSVVFYAMGW